MEHKDLINKAKTYLKNRGFKDNQIKTEYEIGLGNQEFIRVDIVGLSKDKTIAIECGGINNSKKFEELKNYFDEVINMPYIIKKRGKKYCQYCDFTWTPRVENPAQCPRCKRYDWNVSKTMIRKQPLPIKKLKEEFEDGKR